MYKISPLGALVAIVVLGVTVELVEQQNKNAAYGLVLVLLLGVITFNAATFRAEIAAVISVVNAPRKPARPKAGTMH